MEDAFEVGSRHQWRTEKDIPVSPAETVSRIELQLDL
jgi:hypothetical protein